jgi:hypothetical protein
MKWQDCPLSVFLVMSIFGGWAMGQQPAIVQSSATVPRLVNFSGKALDEKGKAMSGITGATFAIYKDQSGGSPLWLETQNVQADAHGNYTVQLGSSQSQGLPQELFTSGEARWLGVQLNHQAEQPRVLLLSVPYALKASDAETVGGLPPSAFLLAAPPSGSGEARASEATSSAASAEPPGSSNVTTTGGIVNAVPLWTTKTNIQSSVISQTGSGTVAKIGIGTSTPATTLDVKGGSTIRGVLSLPATGTATASKGKNSQPFDLTASVFNSGSNTAVPQTFQWQVEPVGNDTSTATGSLNLLFGQGSGKPTETGLNIARNGQIAFATGQTFPGAGTVSSVGLSAPSSEFTVSGSPVTSEGTLGLNWNVAPTSANIANAIVKRDSAGSFSAGSIVATTSGATESITGTNDAANGIGVFGSSASGYAGYFVGGTLGVYAENDTNADLYYPALLAEQLAPYAQTYGVLGYVKSPNGAGVYGEGIGPSTMGSQFPPFGTGVWGDTNTTDGTGLYSTADDGSAFRGYNDSFANPTLTVYNGYQTTEVTVLSAFGGPGACHTTTYGNLYCTGSKSTVVPVDGGSRKVALYAVEAPENWFEDAGSGQLSNGEAVINLEPVFGQTVNTATDYHVFLTPKGDCEGLYVSHETSAGFEVHELRGGHSNVGFDYRVMAKRKAYENIRLADKTKDFDESRFKRPARTGPLPSPQQIREPHRPMVTPPVARVNKPVVE